MKIKIEGRSLDAYLDDYDIIIRAIPGEEWTLGVTRPTNLNTNIPRNYILTETTPNRPKGRAPRAYRDADLSEVLLSMLCDPTRKSTNTQAKRQARYPIPENSNIVKLQKRRGGK